MTYRCLVVVAPITEEFLFRGFLLHRWDAKWEIRPAIIITSLVFGFLHPNFVGLSIFGLVMALLYVKTRTLVVPITCHALNNGSAALIGLLSTTLGSAKNVYTQEQFRADWWIGVVFLVLSTPWLVYFISKNWPNSRSAVPYLANAAQ